ncbi:ankyrin repeat-containing domain protein [Baffinella frigidus]|nr:ankyrin repeat-containing domain protein [Cryptophyta sp. CCMP2293]
MTTNDLSLKSLETLINAGADVNATFEDPCCPGRFSTPLHTAIKTLDDDEDYVRALLKAGAATDTRDFAGSTPLIWAGHHGCAESVALLLEAGADIDAIEGKRGSTALLLATALHYCAELGRAGMVQSLLEAGASRDPRDLQSETPLHLAAEARHVETVTALLRGGAAVDSRNKWDETALHRAVCALSTETVKNPKP